MLKMKHSFLFALLLIFSSPKPFYVEAALRCLALRLSSVDVMHVLSFPSSFLDSFWYLSCLSFDIRRKDSS